MFKKNSYLSLFLIGLFLVLGSFFKLSFALGSKSFAFSGINFFFPLMGAFFSLPLTACLLPIVFMFKQVAFYGLLTLGLPTLAAALCWNFSRERFKILEFLIKIFLPLLCMLLFVLHPVGNKAFLYSFYWFIPVGIYIFEKFYSKKIIFLTSLSSTFLAHAVGSVIWLYSLNMTSEQWISLIPIVAIERLVFACGMALSFALIQKLIVLKKREVKRLTLVCGKALSAFL